MRRKWIFIAPLAIVGLVLFVALGGQLVRLLWNWVLPPLFGWPSITFWQALALLALCRILFGGFRLGGGTGGGARARIRHRMAGHMADHMADRFASRWEHMTPEERQRFRERIRDRCGFDPAAHDA
jgi:hypothetical protein